MIKYLFFFKKTKILKQTNNRNMDKVNGLLLTKKLFLMENGIVIIKKKVNIQLLMQMDNFEQEK